MNQVEKGIEILKQGGIVIFPTDTVYGLGASVFNEKAVRRVFEVKNRPLSMALPVLVSGIAQLKEIV
jgi:L-threonylcarbamoyladenylate synthase